MQTALSLPAMNDGVSRAKLMKTELHPINEKPAYLKGLAKADAYFAERLSAAEDCVERVMLAKAAHDDMWLFIGFEKAFSGKSVQVDAIKSITAEMRMYAWKVIDHYIKAASAGLAIQVSREALLNDWLPKQENEFHHSLLSELDGSPEPFAKSLNTLRSITFVGLYQTLDANYNPQKTQELMYAQAAKAIIDYFRFDYSAPEPVKGGFLIEKRLYRVETQYSSRPGKYRVDYSFKNEMAECRKWLQVFESYVGDSGDTDLYSLLGTVHMNLHHTDDGFDPRDSFEYGGSKFTFFKSKIEIRVGATEFMQLFTFCRLYGNLKANAA